VYYLSDDTCELPVRHVTRSGDNKADPNLETGTYGLFTTCYYDSRIRIVDNQRRWLFFTTQHAHVDDYVISGYYDLSHYAQHPGRVEDYALAAERIHFVDAPLRTQDVYDQLSIDADPLPRGSKVLTYEESRWLKTRLDERPDATDRYIEEIHRLERLNASQTGYRHVGLGRTEAFSWDDAERLFQDPHPKCVEETPSGGDQTDSWRCRACNGIVDNAACLRICRECGEVHTLEVNEPSTHRENEQGQSEDHPTLFSS
jgi:hypothetical protein